MWDRRIGRFGMFALLVAATIVAACGDETATSGSTRTSGGSSSTTQLLLTPQRDPATSSTLPQSVVKLGQGPVEADVAYATSNFAVPFSFVAPTLLFALDTSGFVGLAENPENPVESSYVAVLDVPGVRAVTDPLAPYHETVTAELEALSEPVPDDVEGWLRSIPHLEVGQSEQVEIDGRPGVHLPYRIDELPERNACPPPSSCLGLVVVPSAELYHALPAPSVGTFTVVELEGRTLLFQSSSRPEVADEWKQAASAWRTSVKFEQGS